MQTKQQIQNLLASACISINTRLGQHFLIDLNLMRLLVDSANICNTDVVLEVGCGTGSLTEALAELAGKVIAVEVDKALAKVARLQLVNKENVEIINADILARKSSINQTIIDRLRLASEDCSGRLMLVANLPYNVATPVISNLIIGPVVVDSISVTFQKEVADRMIAQPGNHDYGVLSILLNATGQVKRIRILKPTVFWPKPKVDSAMVRYVREPGKADMILDMKLFTEIVAFFMSHRRKMVKGCWKLAHGRLARIKNWPDIFRKVSIDPTIRPELLGAEDYIAVANLCYRILCED
jgi:16S rRNA (adenine1518-N6/adenine1519-N6)-dimethyltransferase